MNRLSRIEISGFKSLRNVGLDLGPLNVLIGANGAGKSNFVSFFKMLNEMVGEPPRFQQYVAVAGRAKSLLHYGPKTTPQIEGRLFFQTEAGENQYFVRLFHAAGDTLLFADEELYFHRTNAPSPSIDSLGAGHSETRVKAQAEAGDPKAKVFRHLLSTCRVFHFHDTSATAPIRQACYVEDNRWLYPDAHNLAAMLHKYQQTQPVVYGRIVNTIRQIVPFFGDFVLQPSALRERDIFLNWTERDSEYLLGPHQISDGTLRAMALVTLLLQPKEELPSLIVVDEPELGLHPQAISVLAALVKGASYSCQVILSTQSVSLLDQFDPEHVIVVEREGGQSTFRRLDAESLKEWLDDYSLGELWEKNVIGGGPY